MAAPKGTRAGPLAESEAALSQRVGECSFVLYIDLTTYALLSCGLDKRPIGTYTYIHLLASANLPAGDVSADAFLALVRFTVCASCPGSSGGRNFCPVR